jgi:hypothetical protein
MGETEGKKRENNIVKKLFFVLETLCSPSWPQMHNVAQAGSKLMIFLPQPLTSMHHHTWQSLTVLKQPSYVRKSHHDSTEKQYNLSFLYKCPQNLKEQCHST